MSHIKNTFPQPELLSCLENFNPEKLTDSAKQIASIAKKIKSEAKQAGQIVTRSSHALSCATMNPEAGSNLKGHKDFKCVSNENGKNLALFSNEDANEKCRQASVSATGRRLQTLNNSLEQTDTGWYITDNYKVEISSKLPAWDLTWPVQLLCGHEGVTEVYNETAAQACQMKLLHDVYFSHLNMYDLNKGPLYHMLNRPCEAVLFAGTLEQYKTSEFCTLVRSPVPTTATYDFTHWESITGIPIGDGFFEPIPQCDNIEQSTRSVLYAIQNNRPEFPLFRILYKLDGDQNCTSQYDDGFYNIYLDGPTINIGLQSWKNYTESWQDYTKFHFNMSVSNLSMIAFHVLLFILSCTSLGTYFKHKPRVPIKNKDDEIVMSQKTRNGGNSLGRIR